MTWSLCLLICRLLLLATAVNGNSLVGPGAVGSFQGGGGGRRFGGSHGRHWKLGDNSVGFSVTLQG